MPRMVETACDHADHRNAGPGFSYAGRQVQILAGQDGQPPAFAAMEMTIPGQFAGPIPHAHDEFDESIYVLSGRLLVVGDDEPEEAGPARGSVAPRGNGTASATRSPRKPSCSAIWAPPTWLAFMREIGGALAPMLRQIRNAILARDLRTARQPPAAVMRAASMPKSRSKLPIANVCDSSTMSAWPVPGAVWAMVSLDGAASFEFCRHRASRGYP